MIREEYGKAKGYRMTPSKTLSTATVPGKMPRESVAGDKSLIEDLIESMIHRIGRERYALYFEECSFLINSGELIVQAENEFAISQIRNRFGSTLREVAAEFFAADVVVVYSIVGEKRVQGELFSAEELASEFPEAAAGKRNNRSDHSSEKTDSQTHANGVSAPRRSKADHWQQLEIFSADQLPPRSQPSKSRSIRSAESSGAHEESDGTPSPVLSPAISPGARAGMSLTNFQFGSANSLAKAAIDHVLLRPGQISPLVLYGPVGSGKTHLATGLGQSLRRKQGAFNVLQLSAEQFTTRFLQALNGKGLPSLRSQFRDVDLLILEDIQFFIGKKATLVELQHTIDSLLRLGKQLILTVDRHPNDLTFLSPEIQTRLVSGMVLRLYPADRDARAAICQNWCIQWRLTLAPRIIDWLADHVVGDTRRLSGALFRLMAFQSSRGSLVQPAEAMEVLSDYVGGATQLCSLAMIQNAVCGLCGVEPAELNGEKRTRKISGARMLAMFLARKHTPAALSEIGAFFGGRRHSTVVAAEKRIRTWVQQDEQMETSTRPLHLREAIRKIESQLKVG